MTTQGRHAADDGSFARSAGGAVVRGAALVAVAVLIGALLLARGLDEGELVSADDGGSEDGGEQTDGTTPGGTAVSTTTTQPPPRAPADVRILVANGSGVPGAAGRRTDELATAGYTTLEPANAAPAPATAIYYAEGFQAEATAVGTALGAAAGAVQPLPEPPPVDPLDANVVVVLGPDTESG